MDANERAVLIERYTQGYQIVLDAVRDLSEAELDARPTDGGWSAREVVHHLADSEMTSAIRLRRLLVEDRPTIQGYDEAAFARQLHYTTRPIEASLAALDAARRTTAELLARMPEADWSRAGTHTESGRYGVEDWLRIYAAHAHDHARQLTAAAKASA
jgi:hypothetical protein